ncbi:hypothetical protein EZS27_004380 [termite gut metagenome]|uniref:DUF2442 domain-containing protein n=1 Tax=termite gut metagenome TaxID=433724 RepID=A0A5J4SPU8_9ZZZZ
MKILSEKNGIRTLKAKVAMITSRGVSLYVNGHKYYLPYHTYPWFREAKVADILNVEMPDEESLRWEALNVDLHLDSLIHPENYPLVAKMEAVIN